MSRTEDLTRLMEADRWIEKVRAQGDHLPESAELREVEGELSELAERLRLLEDELRPTRDAFNEATDTAATLRQRRSDLEVRLSGASAPARELAAMDHELANLTSRLSDAEDTEVALLLELEPMEEALASIRALAQPLVQRRRALQEAVKELSASLVDERESLVVQRAEIAAALEPTLRAQYQAALARSGVSGAAFVVDGRCDGCRLSLSPLDRDRFRALGDDEFMECPSCSRILIAC